ncbi:hypothetical protein ACQPX6_17635 [Actinomycetospora sp. CA-101289]|uniref:hypothetical protein n=1 Tax=Actinomycetospora sp. CA-101289 TaxID=3239893 RepID=UPI003D994786
MEPNGHDDPAGTRAGQRAHDAAESPAPPPATATALGQRWAAAGVTPPAGTQAGHGRGDRTGEPRDATPAAAPATADDEVVRFGPGVPAATAVPGWSTPAGGAGTRRRRPRRWVGGLLTLLIVAGVVAFLLLRGGSSVAVQRVDVRAAPASASCDSTVDVVGTLTTDGRAGSVRYQWLRSDGQTSEVLSQTIAGGTTATDVHLQWSVTGQGRLAATATLRVLDPTPAEASGGFTYSCP